MRHHVLRTGRRLFGRNRVAKRMWRRISPTLRSKTKILLQREVYRKAYRQPIQPDVVLYEAYAGKGLQCNPHAIFRHLLAQPDLQHLHHVWVLNDLSAHRGVQAEFAGDHRVQFVKFRSDDYFRWLATAGFLVNNVTFPFEFTKRAGQTYLNTWHGVPMKQLGYEVPRGAYYSRNVIRNFLNADYLLSSNPFMTTEMYERSYRLTNVFRGSILEVGTPRVDDQVNGVVDREALLQRLRASGTVLRPGFRYVLFAPTWRGASVYRPKNDTAELLELITGLNERLEDQRIQVLLRAHQTVESRLLRRADARPHLITGDFASNDVLAVVDGLITDYSSIYFDYLLERKPVFFYLPDLEEYRQVQGLLLDPLDRAGRHSGSPAQLADDIQAAFVDAGGRVDRTWQEEIDRFAPQEDGRACARIADVVFRGRTDASIRATTAPSDGRTTLLFYASALHGNGITNSLINLLGALDPEQYDVTVMHLPPTDADRPNVARFPAHVRMIERVGGINVTRNERRLWEELLFSRPGRLLDEPFGAEISTQEWQRCFGGAWFDTVVDFQGYAPYWAVVLSQGRPRHLAIWQHNDLHEERQKSVRGVRRHEHSLGALFQLYDRFDSIVSVSAELADVNRRKLGEWASSTKFTSAVNVIDEAKIRQQAGIRPTARVEDGADPVRLDGALMLADFARLRTLYDITEIRDGYHQQLAIDRWIRPDRGCFTFVTIGRLSPEKNHERMILAFAELQVEFPETQLLIIGDGPLRGDLHRLIARLGLSGSVTLSGHLPNPHRVVVAADCFVLSSDHEGQPLVLLEAMILGRPIVTTDFETVAGVLSPGQGLVVPRTVPALANGMCQALKGEVPPATFDVASYNAVALAQFRCATGLSES